MLLGDVVVRNARVHPDRPALAAEGKTMTHRELAARVDRYAAALAALGIRRGERVAVLSHGTPTYVELLFAVPRTGAVLVPLDYLLVGRELRSILLDAEVRTVLFEAEFEERIEEVRRDLPPPVRFLSVDRASAGFRELLEAAEAAAGPATPAREAGEPFPDSDVAIQVYTTGTTGRPHGAMLSHRNLLAASTSAALELGLSRRDVYLSCTPLPFIAGTGRLLRFLLLGGSVVLLREFDPERVLRTIERGRISHVLFTPAMMARILDLPGADRFNLATLRMVLYGGSSIPVDLLKRAIRFFRCAMVQSYGQVESSGVLTFLHPEDHSLDESAPYMRKLTSVGKEAIGVEVRVVDGEGREVGPGEVGEIVARGPNIFEGYYRDPAFTAEVLRNGWLHTGDLASLDEEGYLYIVDRKRDALMIGGISVYPKEIENVIAEHPAVAEAAVVGRPDYVLGEVPVAIVALRPGMAADRESLLAFCRVNMAPFKVPQSVEFLPALPRNSQGKVLKAKLREGLSGRRMPGNAPGSPGDTPPGGTLLTPPRTPRP